MRKALAVAAALVLFGGVARAHAGFDYRLQLITSEFSADVAEWQFGVNDSRLDANHARLRLPVPDERAERSPPQGSGIKGMPLADIRNLSFDFSSLWILRSGGGFCSSGSRPIPDSATIPKRVHAPVALCVVPRRLPLSLGDGNGLVVPLLQQGGSAPVA